MSIASRIQAIEQHLTDDYNVLEVAGADLTNVDKNILNLKTTWQERLLYFMNTGTDVVWDNWEKVVGEGTTITLNNTEEAPMKIVLKGNTLQNGTPTPETPQDIHVVSGDNSIEVCGKNLFDESKLTLATEVVDGKTCYKIAGINTGTANRIWDKQLKENTQYTISMVAKKVQYFNIIYIKYTDGTTSSKQFNNTTFETISVTSTAGKTIEYITIDTGANAATNYIEVGTIQLEKGTTATTYEPYTGESYSISLGDIELCKIGDYQDYFYKDNGKWYLHKEIGKHIITDSDISLISSYWYSTYGQYGAGIPKTNLGLPDTTTNRKSLCNVSNKIDGQTNIADNTYIFNANANYVFFFSSDFDTKEHANGKLVGANVYFNLDTPTYTEITDTTLLSQLNALAKSYASQTNISQTNDDLPFIINATALKEMA